MFAALFKSYNPRSKHGRRPVADPVWGAREPHSEPKFLYFHAVFWENGLNSMLAPLGIGTPPWEILDPPLLLGRGGIN